MSTINTQGEPVYMKAIDEAKYIINKCTKDEHPISNLQLQKILYYIQVAFLQKLGFPCFDDPIEAWKFGPVVSTVYYYYRHYSSLPIEITYLTEELPCLEKKQKELIDRIVNEKREKYVWDLVTDTHAKNTAWFVIYKNGSGAGKEIPLEVLQSNG